MWGARICMSKKYRGNEIGDGRKALMKEWAIIENLYEMKMCRNNYFVGIQHKGKNRSKNGLFN